MKIRLQEEVSIPVDEVTLQGELTIPEQSNAIIIFSHGSGSSRFSRRNRQVAEYLQQQQLGTLLFDLLTEEEDQQYHNRFDIELLTKRLAGATKWLEKYPAANGCRIGYFGASTGAASALKAAAKDSNIKAIVSRGGRPDLAMADLPKVKSPTLLIVGSLDYDVLQLNKAALRKLDCEKQLELVEGASHLFEEEGKMDIVAELAGKWFEKYLTEVHA
jgi:putative phosphoribosyl transferase